MEPDQKHFTFPFYIKILIATTLAAAIVLALSLGGIELMKAFSTPAVNTTPSSDTAKMDILSALAGPAQQNDQPKEAALTNLSSSSSVSESEKLRILESLK